MERLAIPVNITGLLTIPFLEAVMLVVPAANEVRTASEKTATVVSELFQVTPTTVPVEPSL